VDVDVAHAIAIGDHEPLLVLEIALDPLHASASHGVGSGLRQRDVKILLLVVVVKLNLCFLAEANGEVTIHCLVI
jgi:hypothetical protein